MQSKTIGNVKKVDDKKSKSKRSVEPTVLASDAASNTSPVSEKSYNRSQSQKKAGEIMSKSSNLSLVPQSVTEDAFENDVITDPNQISQLSENFKAVCLSDGTSYRSFEKRMSDRFSKFRVCRSDEDETLAKGLRDSQGDKVSPGYLRAILNSPAGLKTLLTIDTAEGLRAYCELLDLTKQDIDAAVQNLAKRTETLPSLSMAMAIGAWAQNVKEKILRGIATPYSENYVAEYAFSQLHEYESFFEGVAYSKRTWHQIKTEKKRGRRPKAMTARHFLPEMDAAAGSVDVQAIMAEVTADVLDDETVA